jgi:hypothetical protein
MAISSCTAFWVDPRQVKISRRISPNIIMHSPYLSAEEYTATVAMPNFLQVRITRKAISPLLAIKTLRMGRYDAL